MDIRLTSFHVSLRHKLLLLLLFEISNKGFTYVKLRQLTFQESNEQIKVMDRLLMMNF
jgi:hypothetical protein